MPSVVRRESTSLLRWIAITLTAGLTMGIVMAAPPVPVPAQLHLEDLVQLGLARHPKLQQAELAVEAARGLAIQAGLRPNPLLTISGDEIADRTGPPGIWTPMFTQEFVTKKKLPLARAAAERAVDQATWQVASQRAALLTSIRQTYYDLLTTQARLDVQNRVVQLGELSVSTVEKLEGGRQASRIDVLQLTVELERYRADCEATKSEMPAVFRRLTAVVGVNELPTVPIVGVLETPLPNYELDATRQLVLAVHPDLQSAKLGVDRARLLLARAQAEPHPNVTLGLGYTHQSQNRSDDVSVSAAFPIPVNNRNQGNIRAAHAQLADAQQEIVRTEVDLADRVATAYRDYISARRRAERYRDVVVPKARELAQLALQAQAAGQFEALKVLEAQRSIETSKLEYIKSLGDAWKAAATLAGLTLEEPWPPSPNPLPQAKTGGNRN